jgi:hypothetical protein
MELVRIFGGKKFMWDGKTYDSLIKAEESKQSYQNDGFEVEVVKEGGQWFLFTRRVVKEVIVEGERT